jgi:hypothetical protein
MEDKQLLTACKQYCLTAGAKQGNIAYTQNVMGKLNEQKIKTVCETQRADQPM